MSIKRDVLFVSSCSRFKIMSLTFNAFSDSLTWQGLTSILCLLGENMWESVISDDSS